MRAPPDCCRGWALHDPPAARHPETVHTTLGFGGVATASLSRTRRAVFRQFGLVLSFVRRKVMRVGVFASSPSWWLGGLCFAGVVLALRLVLNERIGVLGGYSDFVEVAARRRRSVGWKGFFLVGVVVGGFVYGLVGHRVTAESGYGWFARDFPHHAGFASGIGLIGGGLLIGFGAKTAGGCTSGNGFGGTTSGSPASYVATITFFATAVVASFILRALFG